MRFLIIAAAVAFAAGCTPEKPSTAPKGRLGDLLRSQARLVGYIYSAEQPYVLAAFHGEMLQWKSDPQRQAITEGKAQLFDLPSKTCLGFERKSLIMPTHGPERYLICEATAPIEHRNHLPRSQDFSFKRGDVFLEYDPPEGTGFPQIYYAGPQK